MATFAKLFKNGQSLAVRLPKEFRFKGNMVKIRKEDDKVILESVKKTEWPSGFWDMFIEDLEFEILKPLPSKPVDLDNS